MQIKGVDVNEIELNGMAIQIVHGASKCANVRVTVNATDNIEGKKMK